jgi:DNA polymerase-3 subunit chi
MRAPKSAALRDVSEWRAPQETRKIMTDIWFYHLQRQPLERALPALLERSLERGWTVVVQATNEKYLAALDEHLWSYDAEKFLPHGTAKDGEPETQPIYLTLTAENPNGADVRCFIEGALAAPVLADANAAPRERAIVMFDGNDEAALASARAQWKELTQGGHALSYYQQDENGKWDKKK